MGTIKDKNGMDLTEAEDIKKRWQEYIEELCKKYLHDPDNHDGVNTHLEPDVQWIMEKAREFQKNIYFCFIDYTKAFDCVDHNKLKNLFKRWEYQTTLPASWEICMQVKKQLLEPDMKQQTGSK